MSWIVIIMTPLNSRKKDNYKDHILSLAGQKLYRIRKSSNEQGRQEFMKLIRELPITDS